MSSSSSSESTYWLKEDMIYDLNFEIGKGRFSTVYCATERSTQQLVAVKVFNMIASSGPAGARIEQRLYQVGELELLGLAQGGPHIINGGNARYLEDVDRKIELPMDLYHHDLHYLMESTLETRGLINNRIVVPPWYNTVLTQMLTALAFLHSKKVMISHRDIKPENILYTNEDHFVLTDFGHARLGVHRPGELGGSLEFMAPEIYNMEEQSTKVDVWSLGVLCLDMLRLWRRVPKSDRTFERLKSRSWCQAMAEFGKHCGKPEVKLMLEMQPMNRSAASEVLYFFESSPTARIKQLRPSAALAALVLRERDALKYNNERELRMYAAAWRQNPDEGKQYPPPTGLRQTSAYGHVVHGGGSQREGRSPTPGRRALDTAASSSETARPRSGTRGSSGTAGPSSSATPQLPISSQASSSREVIFPEELQIALEELGSTKEETHSSGGASSSTAHPTQPLLREGTYITGRELPDAVREVMESLGWVQVGIPSSSTPMPPSRGSDVLAGRPGSATGPAQRGSQRTAKPSDSTTMPPPPPRLKTSSVRSSSPARQQQATVEPRSAAAEPARTWSSRTKEPASSTFKPRPAEARAAGESSGSAASTPLEGSPGAAKASVAAPKPKTTLKPGPAEGERQGAIQKGGAGTSQPVGGTDQARTVGKHKAGVSQLAGEEEVESVQKAETSTKKTAGAAESTKGKQQGEASAKGKAKAEAASTTAVEQGETSQRRKADASEAAAGGRQEAKPIIPKTYAGASPAAGGKQEKPSPKLAGAATTSQPARSEQAESVREADVGTSGTSGAAGSNPPGTAHDAGGDEEEQQRKKKKKKKGKK